MKNPNSTCEGAAARKNVDEAVHSTWNSAVPQAAQHMYGVEMIVGPFSALEAKSIIPSSVDLKMSSNR